MTLADVRLDDRDFQSLVDEARRRIAETCPGWNEHNVSDPGITLIEQFAWMTDLLLYRVNRIPERVHLELLALLGVRLRPAEAARALVRFRLAASAAAPVHIPAGSTQVATVAAPPSAPLVFAVAEPVTIPDLRLAAMVLTRSGVARSLPVVDGVVQPPEDDRAVFGAPPRPNDAIALGFAAALGHLTIEVDIEATVAEGAGIRPASPPWEWEVAQEDGEWVPAHVLRDDTGGFNYGSGIVELQLPPRSGELTMGEHRLHWVRCRLAAPDDADPGRSGYAHAPALDRLSVRVTGALVPVEHAGVEEGEVLGHSDGTPGQTFHVRHRPALPLADGDVLEVWDAQRMEWDPWELREGFDASGPDDRHFAFDPVTGTVELGPAVRVPGGWRRLGAVPPEGTELRMRRYRHGGGIAGNVKADALTVLRTPVAGIDSVTNPEPARDGFEAESPAAARARVGATLAVRERAVTAKDVEQLVRAASPLVARVRCGTPPPGKAIPVRILPHVPGDPARQLEPEELVPTEEMLADVARHLDDRRVLGTRLHVTPVALRGATVATQVRIGAHAESGDVVSAVAAALYRFVNPLVGPDGDGWPFGRALEVAELDVLVRAVPGVVAVDFLRLYPADLGTGAVAQHPVDGRLAIAPDELVASGHHEIRALHAELERAA
ncbi:MAG TPA: putative baseplate assembly protein [Solirubrobacteraceae bacterium]|nr:putative baseplate assembly protein [Solirubrobacteraceae bacterium]